MCLGKRVIYARQELHHLSDMVTQRPVDLQTSLTLVRH